MTSWNSQTRLNVEQIFDWRFLCEEQSRGSREGVAVFMPRTAKYGRLRGQLGGLVGAELRSSGLFRNLNLSNQPPYTQPLTNSIQSIISVNTIIEDGPDYYTKTTTTMTTTMIMTTTMTTTMATMMTTMMTMTTMAF